VERGFKAEEARLAVGGNKPTHSEAISFRSQWNEVIKDDESTIFI
jgi:hypothetical protein